MKMCKLGETGFGNAVNLNLTGRSKGKWREKRPERQVTGAEEDLHVDWTRNLPP